MSLARAAQASCGGLIVRRMRDTPLDSLARRSSKHTSVEVSAVVRVSCAQGAAPSRGGEWPQVTAVKVHTGVCASDVRLRTQVLMYLLDEGMIAAGSSDSSCSHCKTLWKKMSAEW